MTISISAAFDSGNINVLALNSPDDIQLEIVKDAHSHFYQWFHFRLTGAADVPCTLKIMNCGGSAYPGGWPGYCARVSEDRENWLLAPTQYNDGVLTIKYTPKSGSVYFAYWAPYSMERHHDLVTRTLNHAHVNYENLGKTLDGQDLDCLIFGAPGADKKICWLIARQHPGESMAEWWAEGVMERLSDLADPVTRRLLDKAVFYVVPNMNPDGSRRGHLRTNAAGINLNREWENPSLEKSPEVFHLLTKMEEVGCDFNLDGHGDESIPHNFIAGFDGIPSLSERQSALLEAYEESLELISPDFQTAVGYPPAKPGEANLSMSTNALGERFGCLAMTLEMPFKDALENPDPIHGWSPQRAKHLGRSCLDALLTIVDDLR
jgi:murein tripeptide amidase MpaA